MAAQASHKQHDRRRRALLPEPGRVAIPPKGHLVGMDVPPGFDPTLILPPD
jgi:hypothetical protein